MTGFGKAEASGEKFTLGVEIKTVNNRFKDFRFKMSSLFNSEEIKLRKKIEKNFKRGSFEIHINYKKNQNLQSEIELDTKKIEAFIKSFNEISTNTAVPLTIKPTDFLRSDFALEDESKEIELIELLPKAFDEALEKLTESRQIEGAGLVQKLKDHKDQYASFYKNVKELKNSYQDNVKEKLISKFEKDLASIKIEETRMLQEVIYYMEKLDIDEEINRIELHLKKLDSILSSKGEIGRQIDFLVQELNRETNTIGSKSGSGQISENVVQMKVQLEKIREQALNME
jgi:uncharacterized protein (TIGR00255 family)